MKYTLQAPDGAEIIGTEEQCSAVARIENIQPGDPNGGFTFDHTGFTDFDDNGLETMTALGETVYRDEHGKLWLERELKLVAVEE